MEGNSVDDISREQLVTLVLRLKDRQKELVAVCRKGEEEKESLKRGLKKFRDEASSKLAKAKVAVERLPALEAEVKQLREQSQTGAAALQSGVGDDACTALRERLARIPAEQPAREVEVLKAAGQCDMAEATVLARVCRTLLLLRDQVRQGTAHLRAAISQPEQSIAEDDDIGAWLSQAANPAVDREAETARAAEVSSAMESSVEALVRDYGGLIVQQLEATASHAAAGESEAAVVAQSQAAAVEQTAAAMAQATASVERAKLAETKAAAAAQHASDVESRTVAALQRVAEAEHSAAEALAARNAAEASTADAWAEQGLANAKIQQQGQALAAFQEQVRVLESEHTQSMALNAELSTIKSELALKEAQSLEYHNALRKLGESVQYSDGRVSELSKELDLSKQALNSEQHSRASAATLVAELRQLADMDVALLRTRLAEERQEFSCELSRLRCELRETVSAAQTSEADVNEKLAIQRAKLQEFRERSKQLMDDKDVEVQRLLDKIAELQEDIRSGRPMERGIFQIAREQAANDRDHQVLKLQLQRAEAQLDEKGVQFKETKQREAALKAQVRELATQASRGEGVDMEYLKNVVVKYMQARNSEEQQKMMVSMLANMLHFTPEDLRVVHNAFLPVDSASNVTSLVGGDWSSVNPLSYIPGYR